jgi:hypothetical protein
MVLHQLGAIPANLVEVFEIPKFAQYPKTKQINNNKSYKAAKETIKPIQRTKFSLTAAVSSLL